MSVLKDRVLAPADPAPTPEPRWVVRPVAPPEGVRDLTQALSLPPLLASVLWSRGLRRKDELEPPLERTRIPELSDAAERLARALRDKKRILIHGDYDADGISGTAVLMLGLRALGGNVTPFIPNRLTDGYGVHPARVPEHAERADLFITVDCGISNRDEVHALQRAGVEVIVTDHHHPGQVLPNCLTVHPSLSPYAQRGLPELTGSGVAYHLLWALHQTLGLEDPTDYSDLASIGTIADVAPLMGENRALVALGLRQLAQSRWPGLQKMIARTLSHGNAPTARDVAFVLAPRLNAAGRLGEADLGLELLTTASERRALELASYLDARNTDRRKVQDEMLEEALGLADPSAPALVLEAPSWHPGVMGIVASKLLERFYKPVFIVAKGKGSVRSTPGISAVGGLEYARDLLERFGGHSQAAGFALADGQLEAFRERICDYVASHPAPQPEILADTLLSPAEIDDDLYKAITTLEPYGTGHPAPVFALSGSAQNVRSIGQRGKHLSLQLHTGAGAPIRGVSWDVGHKADLLARSGRVTAAVSLRENTWQGQTSLEFLAEDVRPTSPLPLSEPPQDARPFYRGAGDGDTLTDLPLSQSLLELTAPLAERVQSQQPLRFDLSEETLQRLEGLELPPTLTDVRRTFVYLRRGTQPPYSAAKTALCRQVLEELALLDAAGHPINGHKRDPYSSETLLKGLMERYKLTTFLKAYRALDEAAFAAAVWTLFGSENCR